MFLKDLDFPFTSLGKRIGNQVEGLELVPFDGAKAESMSYNIPDGKTLVPLFPASVSYENELGGRVLTFSGRAKTEFVYTQAFSFLDENRKKQFVNFLEETGNLPVYYPDDAEVYLKVADAPRGETFVAFFNIGLDPIENITLNTKRPVTKIEMLNSDGKREDISFEKDGETLTLDLPAFTLNPVILFLK